MWNGKTLHFCLRCAAFLQALPQTRCFAAQTQLRACSYAREADEIRPIFSIPHCPAFSLPGFSIFVQIPFLIYSVVAFTFAGTGQNNKTIFYIPHTTTIILCDNLHFPFFVAPHIAIAQKNERSMRMKKSTFFNLPPYGIAQKNERSMRMKKSAVFNLPPYGIAQKSEGNIRMKKSTVFKLPHMELLKKAKEI